MLPNHATNTAGELWTAWASPFNAGASERLTAGAAVAGSAAIPRSDDNVDRQRVRRRDHFLFNVLGPAGERVALSGKTITHVAVGALVVSRSIQNPRVQQGPCGSVSAYTSTSAVCTFVVYPLVARTRADSSRHSTAPAAG
jgi:hypothetical protein